MSFKDRADAGRKLALALGDYKDQQPVVLASTWWRANRREGRGGAECAT
jgi:hypothetical protein